MSEIPPRPWRIDSGNIIRAADGQSIANVWPGEQWAWAARDLIVRLVNSEAQVVEAIRRARNGFVSCYTKVGNVRAWRGTAEDIDWLTKTLDAALALLRGDRPGGDCLGCYPAATKIVLGCPVHDRPGEGGE